MPTRTARFVLAVGQSAGILAVAKAQPYRHG